MTRHGISALVSQTSFGWETSGSVAECLLFSQVKTCVLANSLFIAEGLAQSVGRLTAESGRTSGSIRADKGWAVKRAGPSKKV